MPTECLRICYATAAASSISMSHEALIWTFLSGAIVYLVLSSVLKSRLPSRNNPSQAPKSQYGLVRVSEGVKSMRGGTEYVEAKQQCSLTLC